MFSFEFSLNVFTEFAEFSDKKFYTLERLFEPGTSCFREQDATTSPARHRWPNSCFSDLIDSLNSMKVLLHLAKTPLSLLAC